MQFFNTLILILENLWEFQEFALYHNFHLLFENGALPSSENTSAKPTHLKQLQNWLQMKTLQSAWTSSFVKSGRETEFLSQILLSELEQKNLFEWSSFEFCFFFELSCEQRDTVWNKIFRLFFTPTLFIVLCLIWIILNS